MHGADGACFHQSTHARARAMPATDATRHSRNPTRNSVGRPNASNGATGMAPQHRPAIRIRGAERRHLRALELVRIGIPRGGSGSSRDREQDQRRRADPRGPPPPPPPHPLRCPGATRSPRRRSLPRERRRRRKRPQCGERQWPPLPGHRAARRGIWG